MPFKKGRKKTGGRQKGTPNKVKSDLKKQIEGFIVDNFAEFVKELNLIDNPTDKCKMYLKMMEFTLPKQKQIDLDGELQVGAIEVNFKPTGIKPKHNEEEFLDD